MYRTKDGDELEDSAKITIKYSDSIASLFINGLEPEDAGKITCKATNESGSVKTSASLNVQEVRHRRKRKEDGAELIKRLK